MAKNTAMDWARNSSGKTSLAVRLPALAPAEAKKKTTAQQMVCVVAVRSPFLNSTAVTMSSAPAVM
jgi:hypothetical protein